MNFVSSLDAVRSYTNAAVVNRYQKEFPAKAALAEQRFDDLMCFFWASKAHQLEKAWAPTDESLDFVFIMDDEMKDIDHMWHVFLLYTRDYMDFCNRYFNEYLHHQPDVAPKLDHKPVDVMVNLERFLSFTERHLGGQVLKRWFPDSAAEVLSA